MIRIAAVDDEKHVLDRFERMVTKISEIELCGLFETGEQLLSYLEKNALDAVFLDIEMPDINGIELTNRILDLNENIDIVFVTAFNQYAVEAFELQAVDYILKPVTRERLEKTVKRLLKNERYDDNLRKPFVQCFGNFEVFINGQVLTWKNTKAKEVLAFLVQQNGIPVSWEKIADAVWPSYDSQKAHANFHATNYLLRKRLSEAGISQIMENARGNYRIETDKIDCDLYTLEELIKCNKFRQKTDYLFLEQLNQKGYLEESGYAWAYSKAAELKKCVEHLKISK